MAAIVSYQTFISAANLHANMRGEDVILFDCRFALSDPAAGGRLFDQGHIPGAQYANLDLDLSSAITPSSGRHPLPDPSVFIHKARAWGVCDTSQVVCYDDMGGAIAARMWWLFKWLGHEDVAVLDGGIGQWLARGLELESVTRISAGGSFRGTPNEHMWVSTQYVQQQLEQDQIVLFDARSSDRFTARDTSTDPVAGHVPGALSLPFTDNLCAGGTFRPAGELRRRFAPVLADAAPKDVVNMCGSGVTACHNLLAMRIAGLPMRRLYVGSWSEWIKDPARPVATGDDGA